MERKRIELLPQVWLTVLPTDRFRTNCLSLNLLRPLRCGEAALGALLPSVLLRGCEMCPDMGKISAWLDLRYGAGAQAVVRKKGEVQAVGIFLNYIDEKFAEPGETLTQDICRLLGSFLLSPVLEDGAFRRDFVESEKLNLINEIETQINDKRVYAASRLREEMFRDEPFGVSKLGECEEVEAITPASLYRYYQSALAHSRIELVFAGRTEPDQLAEMLREALRGLPRGETEPVFTERGPLPTAVREVSEEMELTQGNLVMGFRTEITAADPEYPALLMLNSIFGGGIHSKLFLRVREEMSLCYYASSGLNPIKGILQVSSGVDPDKYEVVRDEILRQLELCRSGGITQEEMTCARSALCTELRMEEDSLMNLEDFCLNQEIGGYTFTPQSLADSVCRVTAEDVRNAAQKVHLDTIFFLKGASA